MSKRHHGSSLDKFLKEEGIFAAVQATVDGLHRAGAMNAITLRELTELCRQLDRPAAPNGRPRRTMRAKPPWTAG